MYAIENEIVTNYEMNTVQCHSSDFEKHIVAGSTIHSHSEFTATLESKMSIITMLITN